MSENMKAKVIVSNYMPETLTLNSESLEWGKWAQTPVNCEGEHITNLAFYAEGAQGSATGTQGSVAYNIGSKPGAPVAHINFNVPYIGSNSFSANITPVGSGYSATMTGPSKGNDNTFSVAINKKITE